MRTVTIPVDIYYSNYLRCHAPICLTLRTFEPNFYVSWNKHIRPLTRSASFGHCDSYRGSEKDHCHHYFAHLFKQREKSVLDLLVQCNSKFCGHSTCITIISFNISGFPRTP